VTLEAKEYNMVEFTIGSEASPIGSQDIIYNYILTPPFAAQQVILNAAGLFGNDLFITCIGILHAGPCVADLPYSFNANDYALGLSDPDCWFSNYVNSSPDPVSGHRYMNRTGTSFVRGTIYKNSAHDPFDGTETIHLSCLYFAFGDFTVKILNPGASELASATITNTSAPGAAAVGTADLSLSAGATYIKVEIASLTLYEVSLTLV
jgi:hypothetical protein